MKTVFVNQDTLKIHKDNAIGHVDLSKNGSEDALAEKIVVKLKENAKSAQKTHELITNNVSATKITIGMKELKNVNTLLHAQSIQRWSSMVHQCNANVILTIIGSNQDNVSMLLLAVQMDTLEQRISSPKCQAAFVM